MPSKYWLTTCPVISVIAICKDTPHCRVPVLNSLAVAIMTQQGPIWQCDVTVTLLPHTHYQKQWKMTKKKHEKEKKPVLVKYSGHIEDSALTILPDTGILRKLFAKKYWNCAFLKIFLELDTWKYLSKNSI